MENIAAFGVRFVVKIQEKRKDLIMARHGENIRKRKDGRWEGRYLAYHQIKCKKLYHSVYGRTYEEVKRKLTIKKYSLLVTESNSCEEKADKGFGKKSGKINIEAAGQTDEREGNEGEINRMEDKEICTAMDYTKVPVQSLPEPSNHTFAGAAAEWLNEVKRTKKPSTYVKYNLIYRIHLEPLFREVKVSDVAANTQSLEMISDHLSESIRKSIYCVLNQILTFASRRYRIAIPALNKPVFHGRNKPVEILTKNEQSGLLSVLFQGIDQVKAAILLCLHTGLRLGEVCALKWKDIDFRNMVVSVNRTVQRLYMEGRKTKTVLLETEPKSQYSRREIPLSPVVLRMLEKIRHNSEYIFGKNKPMDPRTLQNHFRKIMETAGLEYKNFHILRHTFATNCIEGGADVKSLSEILGHSNVQISLNRYVHPSMDSKRRYLDGLSDFYGQICS